MDLDDPSVLIPEWKARFTCIAWHSEWRFRDDVFSQEEYMSHDGLWDRIYTQLNESSTGIEDSERNGEMNVAWHLTRVGDELLTHLSTTAAVAGVRRCKTALTGDDEEDKAETQPTVRRLSVQRKK